MDGSEARGCVERGLQQYSPSERGNRVLHTDVVREGRCELKQRKCAVWKVRLVQKQARDSGRVQES